MIAADGKAQRGLDAGSDALHRDRRATQPSAARAPGSGEELGDRATSRLLKNAPERVFQHSLLKKNQLPSRFEKRASRISQHPASSRCAGSAGR